MTTRHQQTLSSIRNKSQGPSEIRPIPRKIVPKHICGIGRIPGDKKQTEVRLNRVRPRSESDVDIANATERT